MIDLQHHQTSIADLCGSLSVERLELFGSATRPDFGPQSDIDVLVRFRGKDRLFDRYFDLKEGLEQILGRPVDVVMPDAIRNPFFQAQVDRERRRIYAA
jgi:predicted nucleotidyltransferase